jgi:hydrogenase maturation protease
MMILGVGNAFRGDDAAGLQAARRLAGRVPPGVVLTEREGDLAGLLEDWRGQDAVIVIDALSSGRAPGAVVRFDASETPVPSGFSRMSTHAFGPAEAIELGRILGNVPPRVLIFGIEGRTFAAGVRLSAEAERGVEEAVLRILQELNGRA